MDFYKTFYEEQSLKGEKLNYIFRWLLVGVFFLVSFTMLNKPETRAAAYNAFILLGIAVSYNIVLMVLFAIKKHYGWIKYVSITLDVTFLCAYIFLASLSSPTAIATSATQLIFPVLLFFAALRVDRKTIIFCLVYILLAFNTVYFLRKPYIDPELFRRVYLIDLQGQIFKSVYILLFGLLILTFPNTIIGLLKKQESLFKKALDNYRRLADDISSKMNLLNQKGRELDTDMERADGALRRISESADGNSAHMDIQNEAVEQTGLVTKELAASIDTMAGLLESQSGMVKKSTENVKSVMDNMERLLKNAMKAAEHSGRLEGVSRNGRESMEQVIRSIQDMSEQSVILVETSNVMNSIAETTDMLSVNAAIEAAHAGEAGLGFAVVAQEIRKLADQTKAQSEQIARSLGGIKSGIDQATRLSDGAGQAFQNIETEIKDISVIIKSVRSSIAEQNERGQRIEEMLRGLEELNSRVKAGSGNMENGNARSQNAVNKLKDANQGLKEGFAAMLEALKGMSEAVEHVSRLTAENTHLIQSVATEVEQFEIMESSEKEG